MREFSKDIRTSKDDELEKLLSTDPATVPVAKSDRGPKATTAESGSIFTGAITKEVQRLITTAMLKEVTYSEAHQHSYSLIVYSSILSAGTPVSVTHTTS